MGPGGGDGIRGMGADGRDRRRAVTAGGRAAGRHHPVSQGDSRG
jgi:hypothetical protein